jgi:DNA topoisomerase III
MTTCIIAEKPSVARDIARIVGANRREDGFLEGADYLVTWAFGHLITLSMPEQYGYGAYKAEELPIVPQPFQLMVRQIRKGKDFEDDPTALKQLKIIRSCFEKSDQIIVATDAGREGELIFRYIYGYLGCQKPFRRLWISSLTDKAIREGLAQLKAGSAYDALYLAGKARSEADWLVGINASRALSIARRGAYSLGRVQTPTLAMICRRYLEHQGFSSVPFWRLQAIVQKDGVLFQTTCAEDFATEGEAQTAFATLSRQSSLIATSVSRKVAAMPPPLLYDLTTLQKEANRQLGYSADKTLSLAQSLYEKKVTTYPRTGSRYISQDVFEEVDSLLQKLGTSLPHPLNPHSVDDSKVTDHHALLPTGEGNAQTLSSDEAAIYQMICARFVAAFAPNAQEERMQVELTDGTHRFVWRGKQILSQGWKAYTSQGEKTQSDESEETKEELLAELPNVQEGENLPLDHGTITQHKTKPKPLFTEATLLSAMENAGREIADTDTRKAISDCGIGTPATRAGIIETLLLRDFIRREKKTLLPTEKGLSVYGIVKDQRIANAEMTGNWELALSAIEAGKASAEDFSTRIKDYTAEICRELLALQIVQPQYPTYSCPVCGKDTVGIFPKVAKCKSEGCDFHVFREICGVTLTEAQTKDLLTTKRTTLIKGFQNKAGKKFNAHLVLRGDGSTAFEFDNTTSKPKGRK